MYLDSIKAILRKCEQVGFITGFRGTSSWTSHMAMYDIMRNHCLLKFL